MIAAFGNEYPESSYPQPNPNTVIHSEGALSPPSPAENEPLFIRNVSFRRNSHTSTSSGNPEKSSTKPLVPSSAGAAAHIMTAGEFLPAAPLYARRSALSLFYKLLCFFILTLQGGVLDFYLIVFTDLYWCSWIATDLVVITGWGIFFLKNARSKRERACSLHLQQGAPFYGSNLGEFTFAYLAWLIYVIACTPKMVLILETSILDLIELKVPLGITGFKITVTLSAPLLYCLINAIREDSTGATRYYSHSCYASTCLDLLDSFTLIELLLTNEIPTVYLKYTVIAVYFLALSVPVLWLYELNSTQLECKWIWARFFSGVLVNAPLLVVRYFLVYVYQLPVSVFMFKNIFFLACRCLELAEQCAKVKGAQKYTAGKPGHFTHCISENDVMCPHGYANTLGVTAEN
ncbi:transmembrane protein 121B-like [Acipenser ruthenus]|uniref:transmembrane protein 121B-like n=1 Tax=Acipenser ruthenus TaxID=7906 RepID=UPI00274291D3|nr:transmembrane protein 121B-like [Acipenser ruthenus]